MSGVWPEGEAGVWLMEQLMPDRAPVERLQVASIETGAICNLRCPACSTANGELTLDREFLEPERLSALLDRLGPQLRFVLLYRFGEPLLNPRFVQLVEAAARRGLKTGTSTNLSIAGFDSAAAERLVSSGLTNLTVSCDGASERTYRQYRIGGHFELVMRNLRLIVEAKRRLSREEPKVVWQFLVNRANRHEQALARRRAEDVGVPIVFAPMRARTGQIPRLVCEDLEDGHGPLPRPCFGLWTQPQIHSDGTVLPCCLVSERRFALGNVLKEDLEAVWNRPLAVAMRRYVRSGQSSQAHELPCRSCPWDRHARTQRSGR